MAKVAVGTSKRACCAPSGATTRFNRQIHDKIATELTLEVRHRIEGSVGKIVAAFPVRCQPLESTPPQKRGRP
jgi:hypothetical protein